MQKNLMINLKLKTFVIEPTNKSMLWHQSVNYLNSKLGVDEF